MKRTIKISAPQAEIITSTCWRNILHTGQGFGKTHTMGLISGFLIQHCPDAIGIIGANTYGQLSDATMFRIFQVWKEDFGLTQYKKSNREGHFVIDKAPPDSFKPHGFTFKTNHNKIFFKNGHVMMLVSMDGYTSIDGREVDYALLDETKDTKEEAVKEYVLSRLRRNHIQVKPRFSVEKDFFPLRSKKEVRVGRTINPAYIFTSPSKVEWLSNMFEFEKHRDEIESTIFNPYDYFVHKDGPENDFSKCMVLASAYHNEKNIGEATIKQRISEIPKDRADMLIFGSPFGKEGVEYYSTFLRPKHVKPVSLDPNYPLHIAFDFNVNPYMTLVVTQIIPGKGRMKLNIFDEFCLSAPKNSIEAVCRAFVNKYGDHLASQSLFIYGDASGKNSLPIEDQRNYYDIIKRELRLFITGKSLRLLRKNPTHRAIGNKTMGRRDFMCKLLAGALPVDTFIDPSCTYTIADFEFVKEDVNGAKQKNKVKINGVKCEKYGHTSDALDNLCAYVWGEWAKRA